jgi:antitoxin (DNA-binding transcriptional repressor) of toxin-antitoxin stability system
VRSLSRQTAAVLDDVERTRLPLLVLRRGRPVAALVAVGGDLRIREVPARDGRTSLTYAAALLSMWSDTDEQTPAPPTAAD